MRATSRPELCAQLRGAAPKCHDGNYQVSSTSFCSLKGFSIEDSVVARHVLALVLDVADLRVKGLVLNHLGIRAQVQAVEAAAQRIVLCEHQQLPADPAPAQMSDGGYCVDVEALCGFVLNERADDRVLVLRDPDMTVLGVCVEVEQHRRWRPADPSDIRAEGLYDALACGRSVACKCLTDDQVQDGPPVLVVTANSVSRRTCGKSWRCGMRQLTTCKCALQTYRDLRLC